MSGAAVVGVLLAGTAGVLLVRAPVRGTGPPPPPEPATERAVLARLRVPLSILAFAAGWSFLGGVTGLVAGALCAAAAWRVLGRVESPATARRRALLAADLPIAVELIGSCLGAGGAAVTAFGVVAEALPGPLGDELAAVHHRLELGVDPVVVWRELGTHPELAPLGQALARAHDSGAGVAGTVVALADDLRDRARVAVEERARSVDVRAAAPLGVCLLPAFLLLGVVPMVAGLFTTMDLFG